MVNNRPIGIPPVEDMFGVLKGVNHAPPFVTSLLTALKVRIPAAIRIHSGTPLLHVDTIGTQVTVLIVGVSLIQGQFV